MSEPLDFSTRPRRTPPAAWEVGLVAVGLAALGLAAQAAWSAQAGLIAARARVDALRREAEVDRSRVQTLEASPGVGERFAFQALLTADAEPTRVLADLAAILPPDVRLDALSLTYGERLDLELQVAARGASAYDLFLQRLTQSPVVRNVVPGAESREGEVHATVRATYVPPPVP